MNSKGVFEVLNGLDTVGLEWWLDGGWGVDARGDGWQPALKG
jgi:hypothetical protein